MRRAIARHAAAAIMAISIAGCGGTVVPVSSQPPTNDDPDLVPINCPDEMVEFVETLEDLDSRLNVGLNFAAYSERVGDARVAYDRIDFNELDAGCTEHVGVAAEDAMNAYIRAYSTWNDCIDDIDCDNDSITPDLQEEWATATALIEEARDGLDQ